MKNDLRRWMRLVQEVLTERRLPNDEKSRLNRAKSLGFDITHPWYHGTTKAIRKFDTRRSGRASGSHHSVSAIFLTSDPGVASGYANVGKKMADSYPKGTWGDYSENFLYPLKTILADPRVPNLVRGWADSLLQGHIDLDAMEKAAYLEPDVITNIRKILLRWKIQNNEQSTAFGARVMPLLVRGKFMTTYLSDNFDEWLYNLHLEQAQKRKLDGVRFKEVVDTTSGYGENSADVLAIINRAVIRSKFANFDPAKIASPDLMA